MSDNALGALGILAVTVFLLFFTATVRRCKGYEECLKVVGTDVQKCETTKP